jgi:uncharacterized membrane protein YuzA (DUF378 family)
VNVVTLLLVTVGAVNWGLVGLFQFDLVAAIFGGQEATLSRLVYIVVAASGLYQLLPLMTAISSDKHEPQISART